MALLYELAQGRLLPGVRAPVKGLRPEFQTLLAAFPTPEALDALAAPPEKRGFFREVGAATRSMFADLGAQMSFIGGVVLGFAAVLRRPRLMRWREVAVVFEKAGVNALPIVSLISLLMGLVIAFEAAQPLEMFGAQIFIADMIGLVMVREFSPIFTAIIFAGRSGSAFAAEIGTMKVNEELNALETMGLDPMRFLVIQRVFAGTMLMPVLAAYSMVLGVFGGVLVMLTMGFPLAQIWGQLEGALHVRDVVVGSLEVVRLRGDRRRPRLPARDADEGGPQRRRRLDDPRRGGGDPHDHRRGRRLQRHHLRAARMSATPPAPTVIDVDDVTIAYGPKVIQKDLTFQVRRGEVFVILGGSGCGKSSLLKTHDRPLPAADRPHPLRGGRHRDGRRGTTASGCSGSSA